MGKSEKLKIKSTIWDNMHYFFDAYNDHCMRVEIQFDGRLNKDILINALNKTVSHIPILKARWVVRRLSTYWEVINNFNAKDYVLETNDLTEAECFMVEKIDEKASAQIKVLIYNRNGKDSLRILLNHMVFDGASLKDFLTLLARYYSGLKKSSDFAVTDFQNGDRRFKQLYKNFTLREKIKLAFKVSSSKKNSEKLGFPYEKGTTATEKTLIRSYYDESFFLKLKNKAREVDVTLNDVFLAAYGRAMFDMNDETDLPLEIDCVIDLRKYIKGGKTKGLTNLISKIVLPFEKIDGESFSDSVKRMHETMKEFKNDYPGMAGLSHLRLGFSLIRTTSLRKFVFKNLFVNPLTALSNIGSVSEDIVAYEGLNAEGFYITGAIKYPPYTLLSLFTFRNRLYISTSIVGTKNDVKKGEEKLEIVRKYLQCFINQC